MPTSFAGLYVNHGRISPYGTIYLYAPGPWWPKTGPRGKTEGSSHWSEQLLPYANGEFTAKVCRASIIVLDKKGQVMKTIPADNFPSLNHEEDKGFVTDTGYILTCKDKWLEDALRDAENGKKPPYCDNSRFVRVSPQDAGKSVVLLEWEPDRAAVFALDGTRIPCEVRRPLSFGKWKVTPPSRFPLLGFGMAHPFPEE